MSNPELLALAEEIAQAAGREILTVYNTTGEIDVTIKGDNSPLTEADRKANALIVAQLGRATPDLPILSEESEQRDWEQRRNWSRYWLVDPLDGTREFVKRNGEFTVNIALIDDHRPLLGVVHVPVTGVTYAGLQGQGASRREADGPSRPIACRQTGAGPLQVVASRSHRAPEVDAVIEALGGHFNGVELVSMGSSLKICLLAEGAADLYPRLGPTSEWDTAAAHAVLAAAGGVVVDTSFDELRYNTRPELLNPHFIAIADPGQPWQQMMGHLSS